MAEIVARWYSVYYSWAEAHDVDVVAYDDDTYGYVLTGTDEQITGVKKSWTVEELKENPSTDAGQACFGKLGLPGWVCYGWCWTPHSLQEELAKVYPKNNDGLDKCAFCGAPTKKVDSILSIFNICTKCGK